MPVLRFCLWVRLFRTPLLGILLGMYWRHCFY